jgi:hypothetical protein
MVVWNRGDAGGPGPGQVSAALLAGDLDAVEPSPRISWFVSDLRAALRDVATPDALWIRPVVISAGHAVLAFPGERAAEGAALVQQLVERHGLTARDVGTGSSVEAPVPNPPVRHEETARRGPPRRRTGRYVIGLVLALAAVGVGTALHRRSSLEADFRRQRAQLEEIETLVRGTASRLEEWASDVGMAMDGEFGARQIRSLLDEARSSPTDRSQSRAIRFHTKIMNTDMSFTAVATGRGDFYLVVRGPRFAIEMLPEIDSQAR